MVDSLKMALRLLLGAMMDSALFVLALVAGGYAVELCSTTLGALGNQDEHGFLLGFEAYHHAESRVLRKPG